MLVDGEADRMGQEVARMADKVLVFRRIPGSRTLTSHLYGEAYKACPGKKAFLTLIGHTSWGMDIAPALAVKSGYPLATDCVQYPVGGWQAFCEPPD